MAYKSSSSIPIKAANSSGLNVLFLLLPLARCGLPTIPDFFPGDDTEAEASALCLSALREVRISKGEDAVNDTSRASVSACLSFCSMVSSGAGGRDEE